MSYSIFYDTQYIKLKNGFVPMILAGDSNCYTVGPHPKRARDWQIFSYLLNKNNIQMHKFFATEQEIISAIDADIENTLATKSGPDKYDDNRMITREEVAERYGWYTSLAIRGSTFTFTAKKYRSFVTNGIKNALTIEELDKIGINMSFFEYHGSNICLSIDAPGRGLGMRIRTEDDFFKELKIWEAWVSKCEAVTKNGKVAEVSFSLQFDSDESIATADLKRFRSERRRANAKPTENVEVDHYFTLKNENGYLFRYTKYGYKYAYNPGHSSKRYQFKKDAERYIKTLEKKGKTDNWKIVKINKPTTFKVSGRGIKPSWKWPLI